MNKNNIAQLNRNGRCVAYAKYLSPNESNIFSAFQTIEIDY